MVVQGLIALALAGPTGGLFGLAYGTAIRVGYEIIYPLLFNEIAHDVNKTATAQIQGSSGVPDKIAQVLQGLTQMYSTVGGLEANAFGINTGVKNAMKQIQDDPELVELLKKNSSLLGQNITVNLSGTGLIGETGLVVSKTPEFEATVQEEIAVKEHITKAQQDAGDLKCKSMYGPSYIAGFDSTGNPTSCQQIVGGRIVRRQLFPDDVRAGEQTAKEAAAKAEALRLKERFDFRVARQPADIQILHQKWGKVSNQTLRLDLNRQFRIVTDTSRALKSLPQTVRSSKIVKSGFGGSRQTIRHVAITIKNPKIAQLAQQIQLAQQKIIELQKYLKWRSA